MLTTNGEQSKKAPKDPVKKRSCIYIMLDQMIQGTTRATGKFSTEIYLDTERLRNKATVVGSVKDEEILKMLGDSHLFHKLVHSVGITLSDCADVKEVLVGLKYYGKVERGLGSAYELNCPVDGLEHILTLYDQEVKEDDDMVGQLYFEYPKASCTAKVTVKLYLNDGYTVPNVEVDPPIDWTSENYTEMIGKSLVQSGNPYRIQKVINKAKAGEDVTIAFLGGSITQGAGAVPINTECYAYQTFLKFQKTFCENPDKCHYIKAGIGGTSSELGLLRCERDIEDFGKVKPDLVVVEFAVNDLGDETEGIAHESLLYRLLKSSWEPAVVMLFSVFADDWNLQDRLIPIGIRYNLPMVSLADACVEQFRLTKQQGNVITKRQYFYDIFHPTNAGHRIMSDCLWNAVTVAANQEKATEDIDLSVKTALGRQFADIQFADRKVVKEEKWQKLLHIDEGSFTDVDEDLQSVERNMDRTLTPQFVNNWKKAKKDENKPFSITYEGKAFFLVVKDTDKITCGKAAIYVDDVLVRVYDPLEVGWTHCKAILVQEGDKAEKHTISIQLDKGDEDKMFTILGLGLVE